MKDFANGRARSRKYRNRRIGEFFKELDLSEKQSTGIFKILKALRENGSPLPEFKVDENRTFMETIIKTREGFSLPGLGSEGINEGISEGISEGLKQHISELERSIVEAMNRNPDFTLPEIATELKKSQSSIERGVKHLKEIGFIERVGSRKDGSWRVRI